MKHPGKRTGCKRSTGEANQYNPVAYYEHLGRYRSPEVSDVLTTMRFHKEPISIYHLKTKTNCCPLELWKPDKAHVHVGIDT
jgi:hypothetical protein